MVTGDDLLRQVIAVLVGVATDAVEVLPDAHHRLRVKIITGTLTVQVSSADITNFDYHSAPVVAPRGEFTEVRVPFAEMKRAWSEQTALNLKLVTSVNLVAFAMAPGAFAYEVDEIGFY